MYADKLNRFDGGTEQAITVTAASTDVIDFGSDRDIGNGTPMELVVMVTEAFTAAGAATLVAALETDSAEGFGTKEELVKTAAIGKATLVEGYELLRIKLPLGIKRYLRLYYTVATGPMTAGKVAAFITPTRQAWKGYPSGYTI